MNTIDVTQLELEKEYSVESSREYLLDLILAEPVCLNMIGEAIELIQDWAESESAYDSKKARKESVLLMDLKDVVQKIVCDVLMIRSTNTLATMASQLGTTLGFADTREGITLAGELLAVMLPVGLYQIMPLYKGGQYHIIPNFTLSHEERLIAEKAMYLPPLIEKPRKLKGGNRSTPYQSIKGKSLILGGSIKHHEGWLCPDVLDTMNNTKLTIASDFLDAVEEDYELDLEELKAKFDKKPISELNRAIKQDADNFNLYKDQQFQLLPIYESIPCFYMAHRVDNRGRIYSQGFHINPQGNSFKKSMIELANAETINVPKGFF
jgi:hypothetical protein